MDEMNLTDSLKLLRDYADRGDEGAFRKLVEQYIDLVYSTAVRRVGGDAGLAQDVTQAVFTDLARKASSLRQVEMLGGWLHRHTGFVASNMVRSEQRRQVREQEAAQMNAISDSADSLWQQLTPLLDDTIESLDPSDRQAVLLRFFERQDFRHIGNALGISDDAAQKRVSRALEKLRALLTERGVTLSVILLSSLLAGRVVMAAPTGMAGNIARIALSGAAAGGLGMALFNLTKAHAFKIALGGVAVATVLWLLASHRSASTRETTPPANSVAAAAVTTNVPTDNASSTTASVSLTTDTNVTGKILLLNIVATDSGKPVPDVELDYWLWINGNVEHKNSLVATRFGVCKVPVPDAATELILVSERDGFADTLLEWHPDRGEQIPAQYTLQLARAVPLGGQVVDPDGNPVAGAQVSFGNWTEAGSETRPQSDDFGWPFWVATNSDSQGRWQINRIGKDALRTIGGAASYPDFVRSEFQPADLSPEMRKQLPAGTYVFHLGSAVIVRGTVQDSNGQPVPNAHVLVGINSEVNSREGKSQNDGTFSIKGCQPGESLLTAKARGFAATTIQVELTNDCGPFQLVLHQGKVVKLRVVDENGNPVPKAQVDINNFPMGFNGKETTPAQAEFERLTDNNGRLEWDGAPDGDLTFDIAAAGYLRKDQVKVPADGMEHVVTLQSGLTISGTASDANTGLPIPKFRIITGWPDIDPIGHTTNLTWSTIDRFWLNFTGGTFQYTYNEEVISGVDDPIYVFKFEADGYAPFVSRCVPATERSVHFDVTLAPAATTEVTVLSPDGKADANADIGLVSSGVRLSLIPGGFSRQNIQSGGSLLRTDDQGQFALPPDSTITNVIAASPEGYAEATMTKLTVNPVMQMAPWGRLEGTYMTNGEPAVGCTLTIGFGPEGGLDSVYCDSGSFRATTDSEGRFAFAQVPPGNRQVMLIESFDVDFKRHGWTTLPLQPVTINSGETTTITIDNTNTYSPITMRFGTK